MSWVSCTIGGTTLEIVAHLSSCVDNRMLYGLINPLHSEPRFPLWFGSLAHSRRVRQTEVCCFRNPGYRSRHRIRAASYRICCER